MKVKIEVTLHLSEEQEKQQRAMFKDMQSDGHYLDESFRDFIKSGAIAYAWDSLESARSEYGEE